ncbi:MAG: hypothetical protein HYR96_13765 [Deltaproteobacteria bacterium]|nr:hypothetical protein [Deltaproteobacteria bacterium]MBI3294726.1 hypothetical protein [Deltaproteobacteria bacterium]
MSEASLSLALNEYRQCVSALVSEREGYDRFIPSWFGGFDRRFHHMREGIRLVQENSLVLDEMAQSRNPQPLKEIVLSNAIEDCHRYRAQYQSYALGSAAFLTMSAITLIATVLWVGLRKRAQGQIDEPHRIDRKAS